MSSSRHQARVAVMQTLFGYEFHGGDENDLLKTNISEQKNDLTNTKEWNYAEKTLKGVLQYRNDIRKKIQEFAPEWPIEKIAPVDRAILELGSFEMLYSEDVPPLVAINEAIEIAKDFGDSNASKFVNGVLSGILKKYCTHRDYKTGKPVS